MPGGRARGQRRQVYHEAAVYSSAEYGEVIVSPKAWNYYRDLGAERSWLGFPIDSANSGPIPGSGVQNFEGGMIYWRPGIDPIAVPKGFREVISEGIRKLRVRLGFPVTEEQVVGTSEVNRIQFFDHGVVTLRDGKREIWMRP